MFTSGNRSDEPQCTDNERARQALSSIADVFLLHDREIANRVDDSVVRSVGAGLQPLRRAHGYAPEPIALPTKAPVTPTPKTPTPTPTATPLPEFALPTPTYTPVPLALAPVATPEGGKAYLLTPISSDHVGWARRGDGQSLQGQVTDS